MRPKTSMATIQKEIEIERSKDFVSPKADHKCRVIWIADLMPNEVAGNIDQMIGQALSTMKQTLEDT